MAAHLPAQTFTALHSFNWATDGNRPETTIVLSGDSLYGTTASANNLFTVKTNGSGFTILHHWTNNAWHGVSSVILSDGSLYGTTYSDGGDGHGGTVFKISTNGSGYAVIIVLTNSYAPNTGPVLGGNTLYGTTAGGGDWGGGTIFKVNTDGTGFAILHSFADYGATNTSGGVQPIADLMLDGNTLYGTTLGYGGTVFKLNTDGSGFAVIHSFPASSSDGSWPLGRLVSSGDKLYGTTQYGGAFGGGTVFSVNKDGSGFALLHSFNDTRPGPYSGLVLNGNTLYGVSPNEGPGFGIVYQLNSDGSGYTILHNLPEDDPTNMEGALPIGGLVLDDNALYGSTAIDGMQYGGIGGGTIFSLQLPTPPTPLVLFGAVPTNGLFSFNWSAAIGTNYQVQYTTNLASTNWNNLADPIIATNSTQSISDPLSTDAQRFYRIVLLPQ